VADVIVLESNGLADPNAAARLTPADLTLPSDFADSSQWPVFWDEGSAVIYERPTRDANDDNATDQVIVTPGSGESLQFDVYEGAASVNVTISASATSVAPGSSVTFTASVPGADSGETFVWNFDGAAPAAIGSSVSATFANAGVYEVSVQATGTKNGFGQIEVDVGSTPAGTGTTTTPTGAVNGSGTNAGASAITPGASGITPGVSGTTPSVSSTTPSATTHTRTPNPKHKSTGATQTPASVVTVVRHVKGSGSSTGSGSAGTGSGAPLRAGGGVRPKGSGPPASGPAATAKRNDAVVVRGRLLGSLASPTAGTDRSQTARSSEAQRVNLPASGWPWAAILGGLVVVALLGLGARRELHAIRFAP
jgi:hypothetical protein